jgi:6,7-dimethyl-8-ribityllumazine synthase
MVDGPHVLIVEARHYEDIADALVRGAVAEVDAVEGTHERASVPGVFELTAAIRFAIKSMELVGMRRRIDAYVALGCVIRGETSHFELISRESIRGLSELATNYTLALGMGILTCENHDQAVERAAVDKRNRGGEAARAALRMIDLKREFGYYSR